MSDGALSQAEIDALLSGGDDSSTSTAVVEGSEEERKTLEHFLTSTLDALSANFSQLTSVTVSLKGPEVSFTNRDALLGQLPDTVTVIKADFNSGFPGEHMFLMSEETAKALASHMTHEDDIQMDDMALSVIGEMVSTLVGTQITALTKQTGNKSIASVSPEAANVPKAVVALPGSDFASAVYQLDLGNGKVQLFWEIYGSSVSSGIANAMNGGKAQSASPKSNGIEARGGTGQSMAMSGRGSSGMAEQATNVQSVQFPNLTSHPTTQEQGNIGLIMDVFMEMTVELGRTKKLIKEILGMGEGTIIELDKLAGEPVDILVNHKLIAKGEVVVIDENFGVRVTEIVSYTERLGDMK
jgi:flagellar motor switch protein FliN/FliY